MEGSPKKKGTGNKPKGFDLPEAVANNYDVRKGVVSKFADSELGIVDLTTIGLKFAEQVAARGYLIKKKS